MAKENDDTGGYPQPRTYTRTKQGQSGNPSKREIHDFRTDVRLELDEQIIVREGGRETKITKQRALVKALVAAAIKGDMRATNALVSFCAKVFSDRQDDPPSAAPEDLEILEEFVGRESKRSRRSSGDSVTTKSISKRK
jgi:Family of unknown function (DUF5681)